MRSYCVGSLGTGFRGGRRAEKDEALLARARNLGAKVAGDIKTAKRYPLQGLPQRILNSLLMKPTFGVYIKNNKDGETKVLYESLRRRNLLA